MVGGAFFFLFFAGVATAHSLLFGALFLGLLQAVVLLSLREFCFLVQAKGIEPKMGWMMGCAFFYLFALYLSAWGLAGSYLPHLVLLVFLLGLFASHLAPPGPEPLLTLSTSLFGMGYLVLPLGTVLPLVYFSFTDSFQDGRWWLVYAVIVSKMTDIAALVAGKLWGRRLLAPRISPKKTIEGALGGLAGAVAMSLLLFELSHLYPTWVGLCLSLGEALALGMAIGIVSQFGDLSESLLKRDARVKDSSRLPGLGGVLDVVDSVVFTAPLVWIFLEWREHLGTLVGVGEQL